MANLDIRRVGSFAAALATCAAAFCAHAANITMFEAARAASGGDAWNHVKSVSVTGTLESPGMKGTWRETVDRTAPRMSRSENFGIVRYDHVWIDTLHWRQANRGGVHALDSQFSRRVSRTTEWLGQRRYLQADGAGASTSAVERRDESGARYEVMTVTPVDGEPVEMWFEATSHLLAKTVRRMNIDTETLRYSDYRTVGGVKLPHTIVDGDDASSATTGRVTGYRLNAARPGDFAIPKVPNDASIAGGRTTVPIRHDGYVTVEAKINGKGPFEFILDTGGHDILTVEAAQALGLEPTGAGSSGGSGEGKVTEQYVRVDRMDIGTMTMRRQVFTVLPMSHDSVEQDPRPALAGIIGLELFERFAVRIDYPRKQLTLTPLASYHHAGRGTALPITFNDDEPLVPAVLNGHTGEFGIDTGNTGSLIVQGRWAERESLSAELEKGFDVMGFGMGGASHNWASRMDLEIGGTKLPRVIARYSNDKGGAFSSVVEAGNIGNDILAHFAAEFDYRSGRLWLEPVEGFTAPPFNRYGASAAKVRPEAFQLVAVVPGGPAAQAGLQVGDEIVAVDGVAAERVSGNDFGRKVRQAPGTHLALELDRKGQRIPTTVVLRELVP